jgi:hypothetical protein
VDQWPEAFIFRNIYILIQCFDPINDHNPKVRPLKILSHQLGASTKIYIYNTVNGLDSIHFKVITLFRGQFS